MPSHFWSPGVNSPFKVKFLTRHVTVLFLVTFAETKTKTPSGRIRKWWQVGEFYHLLAANSAGEFYSLVYIVLYHDCVIACLLNF